MPYTYYFCFRSVGQPFSYVPSLRVADALQGIALPSSASSPQSDVSTSSIVGIVVGVVLCAALIGFGYYFIHKMRKARLNRREEIQKLNNLHRRVKIIRDQTAVPILPTSTINPMNGDPPQTKTLPKPAEEAIPRRNKLVRRHSFAPSSKYPIRGSRRTLTFPHSDDPIVLEKYRPLTAKQNASVIPNFREQLMIRPLPLPSASPLPTETATPTPIVLASNTIVEMSQPIPSVAERRTALLKRFSGRDFQPTPVRQVLQAKKVKIEDLLSERK